MPVVPRAGMRRAGRQRAERVQQLVRADRVGRYAGQPASHTIAYDGPELKSPPPVPQTSVSTAGPS